MCTYLLDKEYENFGIARLSFLNLGTTQNSELSAMDTLVKKFWKLRSSTDRQPSLSNPENELNSSVTYPKRGSFLYNGRQLRKAYIHSKIPCLPGKR